MLLSSGLVSSLTACGGGSASKPPASNRLSINAATAPSKSDCGFAKLGRTGAAGGSTRPPTSGVYRYDLSGTETVPSGGSRKLPKLSESEVTPSVHRPGVACFGVQNRYSARTANARVYLIRGDDVYIVAAGFDTPNFVSTVLPRPAIIALAASGSRWSGSFAGKTSGSYKVEILERGLIKVGGKSVKAVHLSSTAHFRGEINGAQTADTWLAEGRSLVLREKGKVNLRFGGDTEALRYKMRLQSVTPAKASG